MKITWTETHTTEIDENWIDEVFSENTSEEARDIIEDNLCEIMYYTERTNIYHYINNWNEIVDSIINNRRKE